MPKQNEKILNAVEEVFAILKTHKKTGEGFADCISSFWDDLSIRELAELIVNKIGGK